MIGMIFTCVVSIAAAVLSVFNAPYQVLIAVAVLFVFFNIFPTLKRKTTKKITRLYNGLSLLKCFIIVILTDIFLLFASIPVFVSHRDNLILFLITAFTTNLILFWNGIIRTYLTSRQLGIRWRVMGLLCGPIPVLHLIMLGIIIAIVSREVRFEEDKARLNESRAENEICKTRYPILLVHGVFFRDYNFFNYWGRIPGELEKNGAVLFYGNQESALTVEANGKILAKRIKEIIDETGAPKINIIAHSKGGLDSRYALSQAGAGQYVASLTTINSPHRGCRFADHLIGRSPEFLKKIISNAYNSTLKRLGDKSPDFLAAVTDLTAARCKVLNENCPDVPGIYYQSYGSYAKHSVSGRFPLNLSFLIVRFFEDKNDGLVSVDSMKWGERFTLIEPKGIRGITHGDVVDLNRENVSTFDVRETFVNIVKDLKEMGF